MKAQTITACWANLAQARHATREGYEQELDDALDAYQRENYGPPWAPEFIQEALRDLPYAVARQIAAAGETQTSGSLASMGAALDSWIRGYARLCATRQFHPLGYGISP
ncbi:hypothetical protein [Delftia tsuruhatensis]|uniref:hypothetical protein n=1 Tax=Delftia tsuruhatensis TaxID=180282 RepID=UPI00370C19A3